MILGLSHMGLTVSNLDQSLKYYQENLGFKLLSSAERKGDWIDKMTGISGFHSRTVYLSLSPYHHFTDGRVGMDGKSYLFAGAFQIHS